MLIPRGEADAARSAFLKLGLRRYLVISVVMVAVVVTLDEGGRITEARVAVGACSPVAQRLRSLESRLVGRSPDDLDVATIDEHLAALSPIDDVRATADYRRRAAAELFAPRAHALRGRRMSAVTFDVNGSSVRADRSARRLSDLLRDELGLTATKVGCDAGDCGLCTVLVDGEPVSACMTPVGRPRGPARGDARGTARERRVPRIADGVPGARRRAVRHLHAGHAGVGRGPPAGSRPPPPSSR